MLIATIEKQIVQGKEDRVDLRCETSENESVGNSRSKNESRLLDRGTWVSNSQLSLIRHLERLRRLDRLLITTKSEWPQVSCLSSRVRGGTRRLNHIVTKERLNDVSRG